MAEPVPTLEHLQALLDTPTQTRDEHLTMVAEAVRGLLAHLEAAQSLPKDQTPTASRRSAAKDD